jgi:hypothetical protein
MITKRYALAWFIGWALLSPSLAQGRDFDAAAELYSRGLQAYMAGRAGQAESLFSQALAANDQDPRLYYFRALSRLRLGRDDEARADMTAGARWEATRPGRYAVGRALERVQGSQRLLLERYRRAARLEADTVGAAVTRRRSAQIEARDAGALRERVVIPLDELFRPGGPRPLTAEELARRAAAAHERPAAPRPAGESVTPPASAPAMNDDPFRDDASPPAAQPAAPASPEASPPSDSAPGGEDADDNPFDF